MKFSRLLLITFLLGLFQLTWLQYFGVFGVKPDLLLACVVMAGLFLETRRAVAFGVGVGMFKDLFGLSHFGPSVFLFGLWGFLAARITREISIEDNLSAGALLLVIALAQNILSGFALIYSGGLVPPGIFLRIVLLGSLYTALILPLILKVAKAKI